MHQGSMPYILFAVCVTIMVNDPRVVPHHSPDPDALPSRKHSFRYRRREDGLPRSSHVFFLFPSQWRKVAPILCPGGLFVSAEWDAHLTLSTRGSTGSKSTSPRPTTSHRASSPGCLLVISVLRNVVPTLEPSTTPTHHCHWTTRTVLWRASYQGVPYPSPHRMRRARADSASSTR